jgi:cytochrome b subunit of formate dehydrogenase
MPVSIKEPEVASPPVPDSKTVVAPESPKRELEFVRFRPLHRALHVMMVVSFIVLSFTGLSLKFSYTGWASRLSHLLGGFQTAGFIHRSAAVLMFITFAAHIVDLIRLKRREYGSWKKLLLGPDTMLFTGRDLREFVGTFKWFLGRGPRPRYGRWTYWEKFDYFAVFWGIAVIGATGMILWFPIPVTRLLPGWIINVATIIHSDEALLATGFIFTIHFFNTHLRPEKFPMDTTVFTGHMSLEEFKRDKPGEYDELVASGRLQQYLAEPHPPVVIKTIRVFAWCALAAGFSIVVWIVYAMIFAY